MTEEQTFLWAIRDDPDCDTSRLAYADWLRDRGREDQADYIALAVKLASQEPKENDGYARLRRMTTERPLDPGWREVWPGASHDPRVSAYTWKGLYETVCCPSPMWVKQGDAAVERWPINRVILRDRPEILWGRHVAQLVDDGVFIAVTEVEAYCVEHGRCDATEAFCELRWKGVKFSSPPPDVTAHWESAIRTDIPPTFSFSAVAKIIKRITDLGGLPNSHGSD